MRISKDHTAALIIDMQEKLFPHIFEHSVLEVNVNKLIRGLEILGIPMILTEQYPQGLGPTIPSVQEALGQYDPVEKMSFSCCDESRFLRSLTMLNKKYVLVAGIEAHVCVLQTALDLIENGYVPVVVEDGVSSRKQNDKFIAMQRMQREGAVITTCESILLELCRISGTETFKQISALIK